MTVQRLSVPEVMRSLRTEAGGLAQAEALRRLGEFGPNRIHRVVREPGWLRFLRECTHLFALVLWAASVLCFVAYLSQGDRGMLTLGLVIIAVVLINAAFSFWQETRANLALEALERLLPRRCLVLRDGKWSELPAEDLVPGDVLELREGNECGADVRVFESHRLRINSATITGESLPASRTAAPSDAEDVLHADNLVLAGTTVVAGRGLGVVFATGDKTSFGRIAALTQLTRSAPSPLQREIRRVSRIIALLSVVLGMVFFAVGWTTGLSPTAAFIFGIGILVANVPEGLLPTVTLSLAMAAQRMAKRQVAIRHLPAVEALGQATVICTDKTGTLTENNLRVQKLLLVCSVEPREGNGRNGGSLVAHPPASLAGQTPSPPAGVHTLLVAMSQTHSLGGIDLSGDRAAAVAAGGDPLESAIVASAEEVLRHMDGSSHEGALRVGEIPFDASRRRQSVLLRLADGSELLYCKGAPEVILERCVAFRDDLGSQHILDGSGMLTKPGGFAEVSRADLLAEVSRAAEDGLKVIGYAVRLLKPDELPAAGEDPTEVLETQLVLLGFVALADPLRPEVPQAVATCRRAGVRVVMVTGDHPATARAVCRQAGIFTSLEAVVVDGVTLGHWTEAQLKLCLRHPEVAFARVRADQKLRITAALQSLQEIVAMTGDGVNDAPALRCADIGIAMGRSGTDVARESAAMVLLDDNFASIVAAIEEGRAVFANVRRVLTYILSSNIPEIVPYLCYVLLGIPLPLSVVQILAVDLGTDMLPALGLGAELPAPGLMDRPPLRRGSRLLDGPLLVRSYLWLGLWEAAAAMLCYFVVMMNGGWTWGAPWASDHPVVRTASSATFAAIVCMQVINVFLCRREGTMPALALGRLPRNPMILWGVAVELILVMVLTAVPGLNAELGMAPLPIIFGVVIVPVMMAMGLAEILRLKWVSRGRARVAG